MDRKDSRLVRRTNDLMLPFVRFLEEDDVVAIATRSYVESQGSDVERMRTALRAVALEAATPEPRVEIPADWRRIPLVECRPNFEAIAYVFSDANRADLEGALRWEASRHPRIPFSDESIPWDSRS